VWELVETVLWFPSGCGSVLCFHTRGSFNARFFDLVVRATENDRVGGPRNDDLDAGKGIAPPEN